MSLDVTGSKRCGPRHRQWVALGAVALLDEALALWCGPAYAEFADCDRPEDVAVRCLQLGAADRAVTSLEALIAGHPVRERARGLLMSAAGLVLPAELLALRLSDPGQPSDPEITPVVPARCAGDTALRLVTQEDPLPAPPDRRLPGWDRPDPSNPGDPDSSSGSCEGFVPGLALRHGDESTRCSLP
jgi:hypothetical protein